MFSRLRSYEAISGDRIFRTPDDAQLLDEDVQEAWSHFAISYWAGKPKMDQALPESWKARGSRQVMTDVIRSKMGGVMTGYATFFNAVFRRTARNDKLQREGRVGGVIQPAAQEMMGAFPLDPVDNSNLENENEHHGSTRPSEEGARSGRSGQPRLRPQDWQRERPGVDARGAGDAASRSFQEVYAGLPAEVSSPVAEAWRQRIAPAEIAAVAAGRKPAFHEYLGDEAAPLAQALGREFPSLHVEAFDGHLVVADLDLVGTIAGTADPAAASAALREAALSDNIGEYLGYGVPHWNEADAIVTLRDASGEMLAGFHTLNEGVEDFARDRAQDYAAYLGPGVTAEIELKRKPQPQSQPDGQPGNQGQNQNQGQAQSVVSQEMSGAPSQAGDPQGAAPAPEGAGSTGQAAPASREKAAQYFEQAFEASSALFQHLGLGIEEIHTEAEAAARGIPGHISVGVSRDGRRLVVVRPRLEPGTTAALAAAITREELIHAAWIAALREQWRRDPQGRSFQEHLRHEEGRILEELELTEAGREALLNTVNIYHGQGRTQTGPLYTSYEQARAAVDGGLSGMVTELARQLIQMREGGRISEHVFARTMRRLRDWMRKALRGLKKLAARPENASPLLNQAIRDTEAILEGRDISPSPWDAEATEYYGAPSWGDGPPPAMLRLEVPESAPDMAGLFTPTGEGVRGFQDQVAQAAVPDGPVVLTGVQPTVLTAAGAPGGAPLAVLPKVFADMDRLKLNPEEKQALLDHLLRPIAVFGPRTPPYSVRVLTPYLEDGRPVLAEVLLHRTRSGAVEHQVSGLVGMEKEDVRRLFTTELLYESNVRSALWINKFGAKLPPQRGMLYSSAQSYILSPEKVTEWHQNQKTPLPPELKAGAVFDKVKKHLPRAKDSLPVLDANLADQALIDQAEQFLRDHPVVDAPGTGRILLAHPEGREKDGLRTRAKHLVASHAVTDSYKTGPRILKPEKSLSLPAMV
ncbi:hypothetical protein [Verrucomicrobium spinosum]|uniref:hypothetical protein n=1 Tax=Verrucomicrobium spinosum TaxID=2736 RepID=UPI0001746BC3|nr:hypothetical protein [Verrucomicrobium spinosum]